MCNVYQIAQLVHVLFTIGDQTENQDSRRATDQETGHQG